MPKKLSDAEFELKKTELNSGDGLECVSSCNARNCVTKDTKLIIVGTITPPEGAGYFYTAPRNKIYGYIDQALGNTNLKETKKLLLQNPNDAKIIEDIKHTLVLNKIAFLDVIKFAIRKDDSPYDNDIIYYTVDADSFRNNTDAVYICNSKFALECFLEICEDLGVELKHIYLSQRMDTKASWLTAIRTILELDN